MDYVALHAGVLEGNQGSLARAISLVENTASGYDSFLASLPQSSSPVLGITGPPGAGKSSLINAWVDFLLKESEKNRIAVLAVDPSSPFTQGALLGDRLRMSEHFGNPRVFIRSLSTRGALGGLSALSAEVLGVLRAAPFTHIFIETVGVGQSEVDIVQLADLTVVVLVPESGDEIQSIKSGIMEIASLFVVNKSDRPGSDLFAAGIRTMLKERPNGVKAIPVVQTVATERKSISELNRAAEELLASETGARMRTDMLMRRLWQVVMRKRMRNWNEEEIRGKLEAELKKDNFNLYRFADEIG